MAVCTLSRSPTQETGVQPFDARRHLRQVVELVSDVFAHELDAEGRHTLRGMQAASWLSPFFGGLLSLAWFDDFISGFVWVENGRVVGNVTLQRADASGVRWRISNVAVRPEHRGRGIGRALMLSTLSEIAQLGGGWAVLQVRADNPPARRLYASLGFTDVCQDGIWLLPSLPGRLPVPDPDVALQPLPPRAWPARLELAQAARTPLATWAEAVDRSAYRIGLSRLLLELLGNLTGFCRVQRWGVWRAGVLAGSVETQANGLGDTHQLTFAVRPEARGALETALIARGLQDLAAAPPAPVMAKHSGDHVEGVAALEAVGFRPQRILITMRRQVVPSDVLL